MQTLAVISGFFVVFLIWAVRVLNWVWIRPKKIETFMRKQGVRGTNYSLLFGDSKRDSRMSMEARTKPLDLTDDISPRVMPLLFETLKIYGKTSFTWAGPTPRVVVMNPELIKQIFNKVYEFPKPQINIKINTGVSSHEGDKWAKHRKIINPAFYLDKLKDMVPAMTQSCRQMINQWEKLVSENGSSCEIDVCPYLADLTADIISRTAFGSSYNEGRTIFELLKEQAKLAIQVLHSVYIPGWRFIPTKRNNRVKEIDGRISQILRKMIEKREKKTDESDLLGILLESNSGQAGGEGLSIEEVIEECKLFYFAGQETTSVHLVWTLVLLGHHQKWQNLARDEAFGVLGEEMPSFDGLNHLKIITMILYEVLRLYPPLSLINRTVNQETKLGDLIVPAGAILTFPILLIHRDVEFWGADAGEFKPERFSGGVSKASKNLASFIPFALGPRVCVGQNFAMMEAKLAVAMILRRFKIELLESYVHAPHNAIAMRPEFGARLTFRRI